MIHIRANRDWDFVEIHIKPEGKSISFDDCQYVTVNNLDRLIATLQKVQTFMREVPAESTQKWEVETRG